MSNKIRFGIPKGSLQKATLDALRDAGWPLGGSERSYVLQSNDSEVEFILLRPQEMPMAVVRGNLDVAITGKDWVLESGINTVQISQQAGQAQEAGHAAGSGASIVEVAKLQYSKNTPEGVRWVLAVPVDSSIKQISDLKGKVISTELVNVTTRFFAKSNIDVKVEFSCGATEAKPVLGLADAIVDLTETGASLRENNLCIIADVTKSYTVIIANIQAYEVSQKKQKIEDIALLLRSALDARSKVGLKMNAKNENLEKILSFLKSNSMYGSNSPTISKLQDPGWLSLEVIVDEEKVRKLMPQLTRLGACGIIEYQINKILQ